MSTFIPKPYTKESVTIRIAPDKLELIDKLANQANISRSAFINQCIDYAIKHMTADEV